MKRRIVISALALATILWTASGAIAQPPTPTPESAAGESSLPADSRATDSQDDDSSRRGDTSQNRDRPTDSDQDADRDALPSARGDREDDSRRQTDANSRNQNQAAQSRQDNPAQLGVTITDTNRGQVEVESVIKDSPAEMAGILVGDQIVAVDGQVVRSARQLIAMIRDAEPRDQVELRVDRNGRVRNLVTRLSTNVFDGEFRQNWRDNFGRRRFETPLGHEDLVEYISVLEDDMQQLSSELRALRQMLDADPEYHASKQYDRDSQQDER